MGEATYETQSVVHSDPDILGGTPVFIGTRVPVQALIDYIEAGHSLEESLDDFPTVSRQLGVTGAAGGTGVPSGYASHYRHRCRRQGRLGRSFYH